MADFAVQYEDANPFEAPLGSHSNIESSPPAAIAGQEDDDLDALDTLLSQQFAGGALDAALTGAEAVGSMMLGSPFTGILHSLFGQDEASPAASEPALSYEPPAVTFACRDGAMHSREDLEAQAETVAEMRAGLMDHGTDPMTDRSW